MRVSSSAIISKKSLREKHVLFMHEILEAEFPIFPSLDGTEDGERLARLALPMLLFRLLFFSTWSQTASKSSRRLN